MRTLKLTGFLMLILLAIFFAACERKVVIEDGALPDDGQAAAAFVGSAVCSTCHAGTYENFIKTGHPYKLNKASDAQIDGYYPYTTNPGPPALAPINGDWNNVSYVIGGHRWKTRFIDLQGYIITGLEVQYNFETQEWVGYHDDEPVGSKVYDCGSCHTTNYKPEGHQDDLPGMVGTWDVGGIHCEECHGNGSSHVKDPYNIQMTIDRSSNACGQCHVRGTPYMIPASGDFVKHHEQYNEIVGSKHGPVDCVECHDPHKTLHPSEPNRLDAIRQQCESCHWDDALAYQNTELDDHLENDVECKDCHMPRAAKSAVGQTSLDGDVRSHIFTVNTEADAEQFYMVGDDKFANPYLTLDYMCKSCHVDKDQAWMAASAHRIHARTTSESDGYNGGQLYDKFWAIETGFGVDRLDTAFTNNADFYRCKGCHGWDLKGSAGAYISRGPNATRPNVSDLDLFSFANNATSNELFFAIRNSGGRMLGEPLSDDHPDYGETLTDDEIWDLVEYLKETRFDVTQLYDLVTVGTYPDGSFSFENLGKSGDADDGDVVYTQYCGSSGCHGSDGTAIDLGGRSVGKFLRDKAYEVQHKVRFGQLGSTMGAGYPQLSIADMQDLFKALTNETKYPDPS